MGELESPKSAHTQIGGYTVRCFLFRIFFLCVCGGGDHPWTFEEGFQKIFFALEFEEKKCLHLMAIEELVEE